MYRKSGSRQLREWICRIIMYFLFRLNVSFFHIIFCNVPVSTKAEVRFHVQTAEWIPEEVRSEILLKVRVTCIITHTCVSVHCSRMNTCVNRIKLVSTKQES